MGFTTRAAVVHAHGSPPVIESVEVDGPVGDEVVVRVVATGICHTDLSAASGLLPVPCPAVLGHEAAGVVEEVGPAARSLRPGDRVVVAVTHHCGHCFYCESGFHPLCVRRGDSRARLTLDGRELLQTYGTGTFADRTVLREISLAPVPDEVPLDVAAVVGCAVVTGFGAVTTVAALEPGSVVAVVGCGGVGMSVILAARAAGAARVVAADPSPGRRAGALRLGADEAVEATAEALREAWPAGYDYSFECAGRIEAMTLAVEVTRPAATTVLLGITAPSATLPLPAFAIVNGEKRILGCNMGRLRPHVDFQRCFRLFTAGRLPVDALISERMPLDAVAAAFEAATAGEGIRTLLTTGAVA